jgi:hypothetical protein
MSKEREDLEMIWVVYLYLVAFLVTICGVRERRLRNDLSRRDFFGRLSIEKDSALVGYIGIDK